MKPDEKNNRAITDTNNTPTGSVFFFKNDRKDGRGLDGEFNENTSALCVLVL